MMFLNNTLNFVNLWNPGIQINGMKMVIMLKDTQIDFEWHLTHILDYYTVKTYLINYFKNFHKFQDF